MSNDHFFVPAKSLQFTTPVPGTLSNKKPTPQKTNEGMFPGFVKLDQPFEPKPYFICS
jgi:hypothetical protein